MQARRIDLEEVKRQKNQIQWMSLGMTFLIGLFMHQYVMSNKFFNFFEMGNIMADMSLTQGDTLALGRWFLPVATNLFTSYSMPGVNGVMLIGSLSISACLICNLFGVRRLWGRILAGLLMLSFPGVAVSFSYGVNADAMGIGILLAVFGVWLEETYRYGFVPGILLIGMSIGVYQPYVSVGIAIIYGILLFRTMEEHFHGMEFVKAGLRRGIFLVFGFVFYYVMLQIVLAVTGLSLSNYHGVDSMTSFTVKGLVKGVVYAYIYFLRYFFLGFYADSPVRLLGHYVVALLVLVMFVGFVEKIHRYANKGQMLWLFAMLALLPLGVNGVPFLMADRVGSGVDLYMLHSMMVFWVIFVKWFEMWYGDRYENPAKQGLEKKNKWFSWFAVGALVFTIWNGYIICNQAYHRMEAMTQTTTSLIERMVARIEVLPEWKSGMPVYFVNPRPLVNENYQVDVPLYDQMENMVGTEIVPWYNERAIARYMNVYLRFPVTLADEKQEESLSNRPEVEAMPSFPAQDSMQVMDGVLVVKVSNGEEVQ